MKGALIILAVLIAVGIILYLGEMRHRKRVAAQKKESGSEAAEGADKQDVAADAAADEGADGVCCGQHLVCEKNLLTPMDDKVEYYDDEELDRFIGRSADSYTDEEAEEFREVLMTLREEDAPGWARSITLRGLELPSDVRDALLMIVREARNKS